jgi:hypothetical protein
MRIRRRFGISELLDMERLIELPSGDNETGVTQRQQAREEKQILSAAENRVSAMGNESLMRTVVHYSFPEEITGEEEAIFGGTT